MATNVPQYNTILDAQVKCTRAFVFYEDDGTTPLDVSLWTFAAQLINSSNAVVWDILNGDFTRSDTNSIQFSKLVSDVALLADGLYTFSLKATNGTEFVGDEILNGFWRK